MRWSPFVPDKETNYGRDGQFSLSPDPSSWGADTSPNYVEADDFLHNPDPRRDRVFDLGGSVFTRRGFANLGCLVRPQLFECGVELTRPICFRSSSAQDSSLFCSLLTMRSITFKSTHLFCSAGFPIISFFTTHKLSTLGGFNLGGTNATGQIPSLPGNWAMIDKDTPQELLTKTSYVDGTQLELVFSDEFNVDGRTFYPGDDPYWEAVDLHYWQTNNMEWWVHTPTQYECRQLTTTHTGMIQRPSQQGTEHLRLRSLRRTHTTSRTKVA